MKGKFSHFFGSSHGCCYLPAALLTLCFLLLFCAPLALLCTASAAAVSDSGTDTPPDGRSDVPSSPRITVLGDSISEGYGLDGFVRGSGNPTVASYGNLTAKALGSAYGKEYHNLSVSGDTSADLLALVGEKSGEIRDQSPDLIFITVGGNDLIRAATEANRKLFGDGGIISSLFSGVPGNGGGNGEGAGAALSSDGATVEQLSELRLVGSELKLRIPGITSTFGENLSAIILTLHTLAPEAQIYVQTIYDPLLCTDRTSLLYSTLSVASSIVSPLLEQMNEVIRALSSTLDYTVVDAAGAFEAAGGCPVTNILSFDIHPNAEGHALLAKLTLEAVEKNRPKDADGPPDGGENMGGDRPDGGDRDGNSPDNTPTTAPDSEEKDSVTVSAGNAPSPGETGVGNETARPDGGDAAPDGKGGKAILCILLSAVSAAGCAGVVLLYKSHRRG